MKVILRADVDGLGRKGDICDVAPGHARNHLIPRGLALKSSAGAERQAQAMRRSAALRQAADRADAEQVAARLKSATVTVEARVAGSGQLYGSVSANDLVRAIEEQTGAVVAAQAVALEAPLKEAGSHAVALHLYEGVEATVTVEVVAV